MISNDDLMNRRLISRRYRNRRIGDFLKELKLVEGRNTGTPTILHAMEANGSELDFIKKYSFLGFMTALPTTADFITYESVYLLSLIHI